MPDWRNKEDYNFTDSLSLNEWFWEFHKREIDRRDDWPDWRTKPQVFFLLWKTLRLNYLLERYGAPPEYIKTNPSFLPGMVLIEDATVGPVQRYFNPDDPSSIAIGFDLTRPINKQIEIIEKYLKEKQTELQETGSISLRQIRAHKQKWKDYLRCLDAEQDRATLDDMATHIFDFINNSPPDHRGNKRVLDTLKQAKNLMCNNILSILYQRS